MATFNKDFRVKHGLIVEANTHLNGNLQVDGTINGLNVNSQAAYTQAAFDKANTGGGSANVGLYVTNDTFTANGLTDSFTLSVTPIDEDATIINFDGITQQKSQYSLSGSTITFTETPNTGTLIEVTSFVNAGNGIFIATEGGIVDNVARDTANASFNTANSAGIYANTGINNAASASVYANNAVYNAASASIYANTGINNAASASLYANTAINNAASASVYANDGITLAQSAFNQGNSTATVANTAINNAASASLYANTSINNAASASQYANNGITLAQAAYNEANLKFNSAGGIITGNVTISGNNDLVITGNLYVQGNTVTTNTQSFVVADPVILLASGNFYTDAKDIGFAAHYNDGTNAHTGFIRDYVTKEYYIFDNYTPELDANNEININDASFREANVHAGFFKGNLIANTAVVEGVNLGTHIQSAYNQGNSTAIVANTDFTTISTTAATYGNATSIPVITLAANGRVSSITNTTITTGTTITNETSSSNDYYPLLTRSNSGSISVANTSSTKLKFVPSTGILTVNRLNLANGASIRDNTGDSVAFGEDAGAESQGSYAVAVGFNTGGSSQAFGATALGAFAGNSNQGQQTVSVGVSSGYLGQNEYAVAIGSNSGYNDQGTYAVALGADAGNLSQGAYSVAIGRKAGETSQGPNSIILNATGSTLDQTTANTFTVKPIRKASAANTLYYNEATGEITFSEDIKTFAVGGLFTGASFSTGKGNSITFGSPSGAFSDYLGTLTGGSFLAMRLTNTSSGKIYNGYFTVSFAPSGGSVTVSAWTPFLSGDNNPITDGASFSDTTTAEVYTDIYLARNSRVNDAITTITDDTSTNATRFVMLGTANSGFYTTANTSSTKLLFNPSTGTLSANTANAQALQINGTTLINSNRTITNYGLKVNALGTGSGNRTIDLSLGNFITATTNGTTTWTFSNPIGSPDACGFILELTNGGSATQNWPTPSVKWPGGTAPTLTSSGVDILVFVTDDGGTTWRGVASMLDSK